MRVEDVLANGRRPDRPMKVRRFLFRSQSVDEAQMLSLVPGVSPVPAQTSTAKVAPDAVAARIATTVTPLQAADLIDSAAGQLNVAMLSRQQPVSEPLLAVVDMLGQAMGLERRPDENAVDYLGRIGEALGSLSKGDQVRLQALLSKTLATLQLGTLLAAIRNPLGPESVALALDLEASAQKTGNSAVLSSYRMTELEQGTHPANGQPGRSSAQAGPAPARGPSIAPDQSPVPRSGQLAASTTVAPANAQIQTTQREMADEAVLNGQRRAAGDPEVIADRSASGARTATSEGRPAEIRSMAQQRVSARTDAGRAAAALQAAEAAPATPRGAETPPSIIADEPGAAGRSGKPAVGRIGMPQHASFQQDAAVAALADGEATQQEEPLPSSQLVQVPPRSAAQGEAAIKDEAQLLRALLRLGAADAAIEDGRDPTTTSSTPVPPRSSGEAEEVRGRIAGDPAPQQNAEEAAPHEVTDRTKLSPPPLAPGADELRTQAQIVRDAMPFAIVHYLFEDADDASRDAPAAEEERQEQDEDKEQEGQDDDEAGGDEPDQQDDAEQAAEVLAEAMAAETVITWTGIPPAREILRIAQDAAPPVVAALLPPVQSPRASMDMAQGLYLRLSDGI